VQFAGATYTVDAADAGKTITVLERAMNATGGASSRSAGKVIT
jgi:glycine/D-amino acid oxidase-like deaminating enzyme